MTMSLFVLSGASLVAEVQFEGPLGTGIAGQDPDTGTKLQKAIDDFANGVRHGKVITMGEVVDFEHLNVGAGVGGGGADMDAVDMEGELEVKEGETSEQRRERRAKERKKALEARQQREHTKIRQKNKVREEGEPFQWTVKVVTKGWYQFCVQAKTQVVVEIDFRKESEMGGRDDNGHVWTYEQKMLDAEDKMMEEDTAVDEGIKNEDFQATKQKLKSLRKLFAEIQNKQNLERHRLMTHASTNRHSHSRMVVGSLVETLIFLLVTGFQVYTIRRWFKGASVLGR
jgi:hypothetical protein